MDKEIQVSIISNELCRRSGIAATWLPINNVSIFAYQKKPAVDKPSAFAPAEASVFHVRENVILFQPILRKFINESNGTFLALQQINTDPNSEAKVEIPKLSRQYRSIIRACLENLQEEAMRLSGIPRDEIKNFITILYSVECVWHLCEILFLNSIPGQVILPHLLEWIRFHFPKHERKAAVFISSEDVGGPEADPDYWECVIGLLLQGRITVVRTLLKMHSQADTQAFRLVDQCLKAIPSYNVYSGVSTSEFMSQWNHWVLDVKSKLEAQRFTSFYNLNLLMKLVVGEENAWDEIIQYCETWYEYLAAWLFFTQPTVKSFELGQFAKQAIARMSVGNRLKHLDQVLLNAMEFNILEVIKEIKQMSENGWFATHFTDLLHHLGVLQELTNDSPSFSSAKLRESFLIDYGSLLMSHRSLWQVGLSYLDHSPVEGLEVIKMLLPRLATDSEFRTQRIVREALNRNLPEIAQSICKVKGIEFKNKGRLGNALAWGLKSQDSSFISYLSDKFLHQYCENGELQSTDLLDNLGPCILASDRLMFLGKYSEFHALYQARQYKEASGLLISLLESKITPTYFWNILLTETLPLMESDEMVFSSMDTYTILQCLEEKEHCKDLKEKIALLKLAASRNLARALLHESQLSQV